MTNAEKRFNNKAGDNYDLLILALPHHDLIQSRIAEVLSCELPNTQETKSVLEIGFGTGLTSVALLKSNQKITITALDDQPTMLEKAKQRLLQFQDGRIILKIADALSFLKETESNTYDAIVSGWVFHNLKKDFRKQLFQEIFRALKPGGVLVSGDKIAVDDSERHNEDLKWQISQFDIFDKLNLSDLKDQWIKHYAEDEKEDRLLKESDLIKELNNLGFIKINITDRHHLDAVFSAKKP